MKTLGRLSNRAPKSIISLIKGKLFNTPGMKEYNFARDKMIGQFFEAIELKLVQPKSMSRIALLLVCVLYRYCRFSKGTTIQEMSILLTN